jgi:nicotinate-nucleotide adenylyltransferase
MLVGGVFDPPHRAHLQLPALARSRVMGAGAWLVYVPAARSPLKPEQPRASDADRVAMLRLALEGVERAAVWTDEIDRAAGGAAGPSYWIETLERARRVLEQGVRLRFAIGADQAAQFHRWRRAREILQLAEPVVLLRAPNVTAGAVIESLRSAGVWSEQDLTEWALRILDGPVMDDSATEARAALARGDSVALARMLGPSTLGYIRERGLYR